MATPTDSHRPPDETDSGPEHGSGETAQKAGPKGKYRPRILGKTTPTDSHRPPDQTDSGPEHGSGETAQKAGPKGKYRRRNIGKTGHPAGPSVVDTVVDNPSGGKELRSKRQEALSAEECRETQTVQNKFSPRKFTVVAMFKVDDEPVDRPNVRVQYGKRPKTSAQMKELPHTLQESGGPVSRKKDFGEPGGQAKSEFHTSPVPSSSQSTKLPPEVSLNLDAEIEMLYATPDSLDNVHRQMKQSNLRSSGVTDEVEIQRGATEGDPKADVKQVTVTGNEAPGTSHLKYEVLPPGTETGFGTEQGKLNANEPDRAPTRNNVVSLATGVLTKCDKLTNICGKPRKFLHIRNEVPEMLKHPSVLLRAKTETTSGTTKEQLNVNEPDTIPIGEKLVSMALSVLTKCQKMASICREITDVFPDRLLPQIMASSRYPILHPFLCFMLIEISFLIIKLLSELISALMSLIYIIIHKGKMDIVPDNIFASLDTLVISLLSLEMKYKLLCIDLIIDVKILTPEELAVTLKEIQTECMQTDMSEQTGVSGEKTETPHEQDEACSVALLEVSRCSLTLMEKDSVKMRLRTVGLKLDLIEQKIVPLTAIKNP